MGLINWLSGSGETDVVDADDHWTEDVLISGGTPLYTFTANDTLSQREAVKIDGDNSVSRCHDTSEFYGIVPFDVSEGEFVPAIQAPAIVKVRANDYIEPNSGVRLSDSKTWVEDNENRGAAIVHSCDRDTLLMEVELRPGSTLDH